jgi:hypothetical protein
MNHLPYSIQNWVFPVEDVGSILFKIFPSENLHSPQQEQILMEYMFSAW